LSAEASGKAKSEGRKAKLAKILSLHQQKLKLRIFKGSVRIRPRRYILTLRVRAEKFPGHQSDGLATLRVLHQALVIAHFKKLFRAA
jgi:hypothetical protein